MLAPVRDAELPVLGASLQRQIIEDCRRQMPNQACGLVLFDSARQACAVEPVPNRGAWPYGFQIPPNAQFTAFRKALSKGWVIGGVYHCHLVSEAVPTGRDLKRPVPKGFLYIVVSMLRPERPSLRAYLFDNGIPHEVAVPHWEE